MEDAVKKEKLLNIGAKKVDVSNVSYNRKFKAQQIWNNKVTNTKDFNLKDFNNLCDKMGIYLARQEFNVLLRRMTFKNAIKEYIKRLFITVKYIRKSSIEEYDDFQAWVHFTITGVKKKELESLDRMQKITIEIDQQMQSMGYSQDQSKDVLLTLLQQQGGLTSISEVLQNKPL